MKNKSTLYAALLILLLLSCKSKETLTERTKTSDSLLTSVSKYESKPISTNYQIMLECDSLGRVKPVNALEKSGVNSFGFSINNQMLNIWGETGASFERDSISESKQKKDTLKDKSVVKWRTPAWHWWAHAVALLVIFIILKFKIKIPFI